MMVTCPTCKKENIGYRHIKPGLIRFSDCGCPVLTMKDHAIEAGMHPEITRQEERAISASNEQP